MGQSQMSFGLSQKKNSTARFHVVANRLEFVEAVRFSSAVDCELFLQPSQRGLILKSMNHETFAKITFPSEFFNSVDVSSDVTDFVCVESKFVYRVMQLEDVAHIKFIELHIDFTLDILTMKFGLLDGISRTYQRPVKKRAPLRFMTISRSQFRNEVAINANQLWTHLQRVENGENDELLLSSNEAFLGLLNRRAAGTITCIVRIAKEKFRRYNINMESRLLLNVLTMKGIAKFAHIVDADVRLRFEGVHPFLVLDVSPPVDRGRFWGEFYVSARQVPRQFSQPSQLYTCESEQICGRSRSYPSTRLSQPRLSVPNASSASSLGMLPPGKRRMTLPFRDEEDAPKKRRTLAEKATTSSSMSQYESARSSSASSQHRLPDVVQLSSESSSTGSGVRRGLNFWRDVAGVDCATQRVEDVFVGQPILVEDSYDYEEIDY